MGEQTGFILLFLGLFVVFIGLGVFFYLQDQKRRAALRDAANALGLKFSPDRDAALAERYRFLNQLREGSNRYAQDISRGRYRGEAVEIFDFHYETYSRNKNGGRTTHHHWHHLLVLGLPREFPELTIARENIFTRLAKNFGFASIDFESNEFSRTFLVRSPDKRFAYDICHPRAMEFLLENRDLTLEIEGPFYVLIFPGRQKPERLQSDLDRLLTLRGLMPAYLFEERGTT